MQPLLDLVQQARAIAEGEVARELQICNACRYCEGFCAVFPAMTRRLEFNGSDIHYLANLCHNCGACLHACQYAPPHEFAVNLPQAMAQVRRHTYQAHAWPAPLGAAYAHNGLVLSLALVAGLALFLALAAALNGGLSAPAGGNFYSIFPHGLMVSLFLPVFAFVVLALAIGVRRFWRSDLTSAEGGAAPGPVPGAAVAEATHDALKLRYLDGGHGEGCNNENDAWTRARRHAHHLTFYGFMLCFASTSVATLYHYAFDWVAPYGWTSWPKLLGMVGGVMLTLGTAALWQLRRTRHPAHVDAGSTGMDLGFIALLFIVASSGLALALARGSALMPALLCLHLGAVLAFFATMPYGKFAHGVYRVAAMLKYAVERRQPGKLRLGSE